MWPLLKKDGLGLQYIATLLLWNRLIGHNPFTWPPKSRTHLFSLVRLRNLILFWLTKKYGQAVYTACLTLHLLEMVMAPPRRYPDLFAVLNVLVCTPVFVLGWLWSIKGSMEVGWTVGGVGPVSAKTAAGVE